MSADTKPKGADFLPLRRIISKRELLRIVPYCDQHILRLEKKGKFPRRLVVGENRVGWHEDEILAWINGRERRQYGV